jgi:hypothetical protein
VLALQASAGNQAVARALDVAREVGHDGFNPGSIVHDLRRAIDQAEASEGIVMDGITPVATKRKVDAALVIRVLDGLTPEQVDTVKRLYLAQEKTPLENDLFGLGQTGYLSTLNLDQRARIQALLKGTGGNAEARLEAVAIELHELLSGSLDDTKRERVMALYRRPRAQIEAFESHYQQRYGHGAHMDLVLKLPGLHLSRVMALRAGNSVLADSYAIEDKRRALDELQDKKDRKELSLSEAMGYEKSRRRLIDGITGIADANRRGDRLKKILATPGAKASSTLGDQLADTLKGTEAAGIVVAMTNGSFVETAARRVLEMEARDTTSAEKIAQLMRDLRAQAMRDAPAEQVSEQARRYVDDLIATYNRLKPPDGRTWAQIVASAEAPNEDMLDAMAAGGGRMAPVDELRYAIRSKNAAAINALLRKQETRENITRLEEAYKKRFKTDLRQDLFGILGGQLAGIVPAAVRGREAALTQEYLNAPGERGGKEEADWIAGAAQREADATTASSGIVGSLRELGDVPETQRLMQESAARMRELHAAWKDPGNAERRDAILTEMKQVRATLTGDATAYEDENAQMRAQIRSAVSLAVQAALAIAIPGIGSGLPGFMATTALNIGTTVASNAIIYGEDYTLKMLYDDIVGGGLGALGSKLGEDVVQLLAKQVGDDAAKAVIKSMSEAGQPPALIRERAIAAASAQQARLSMRALAEVSGFGASTVASGVVTGEDGFTFESIVQNFLMNRLGGFRAKPGAAGGAGPINGAKPREAHGPTKAADGRPDGTPADGVPVEIDDAPTQPHQAPEGVPEPVEEGPTQPYPDGKPPPDPEAPVIEESPEGGFPDESRPAPDEPEWQGPIHETEIVPENETPTSEPTGPHRTPSETMPISDQPARTRPASAGERLESRATWRAMEQLASRWPGMGDHEKCAGLADIANGLLGVRNAPGIRVVAENPGRGNDGRFNYHEWTIQISPDLIAQPSLPPEIVAKMQELARHETEHALQWWAMARLRASEGAGASEIVKDMHGIPFDVAAHAVRTVESDGMGAAERAAAQVLWDTVYSPNTTRDANLTQLDHHRQELERFDADIRQAKDSGLPVDPAKLQQRDHQQLLVDGFDAIYRGSAEERIAYEKGAIAGTEATLEQLRLEVDLAEVAFAHAVEDARAAEAAFLATLSQPDLELLADYAGRYQRVENMRTRADEARTTYNLAQAASARAAQPPGAVSPPRAAPPARATRRQAPALPGGSVPGKPATPRRETKIDPEFKKNDPQYLERKFHPSAASLRAHIGPLLKRQVKKARKYRRRKEDPGIDQLLEQLEMIEPGLVPKARSYYDALNNPQWIQEQMVYLWEQAAINQRTVAEELRHQLGDGLDVTKYRTDEALEPRDQDEEFRKAISEPKPLVDLTFQDADHGSHVHMFHEWLGDRLFKAQHAGREFRQAVAKLHATGDADAAKPFWSRIWEELFDSFDDHALHNPEVLGRILQNHLDFPRTAEHDDPS